MALHEAFVFEVRPNARCFSFLPTPFQVRSSIMRITCSQAPVSNPAERKPPPKPPPKGKKTKQPLVSQSLNGMAVPPAPDWGPPPGIGGSTFSHPTLDEDNDLFFYACGPVDKRRPPR
ncbi:hypothetical protein K439DRAFT_1619070 [Ramaria rubella]|nr:hypothetical protein K439DRAFT_1619070 [Ramaria rubella]